MKRNNINRSLIAAAVVLITGGLMYGCSKSFLDVPAQGQRDEDAVKTDPNAAQDLVIGTYNTLYFGGFDNNTVGLLYAFVTDITSDDADKGSTAGDAPDAAALDNFTYVPTSFYFNNIWNGHYQAIARVNQALQVLNNATFDETLKKQLIGEVRLLRGFYYFNLVRLFGGVPVSISVPDPTKPNDDLQTRQSVDSVYSVIISDLQYAVDNLPLRGEAGTTEGRANKGTAEAYLAKVYLYRKDYQKAFDLTSDIIGSGKYSLVPDYSLIFRENAVNGAGGNNNTESIFEVQTGSINTCDAISKLYSNGQGPRAKLGWPDNIAPSGEHYNGDLGFGLNNPSQSLSSAYEAGDTRRNATIIFIQTTGTNNNQGTILWDGFRIPTQDSVENPRYSYKAYHSPLRETAPCKGINDKDDRPKNIRLMRYSEVLLMYAEAAMQLGNAGEATNKLNMVRNRAGLTNVTATLDNIYKERRVELGMEQDRFFDLVRTGRAVSVLGPLGFTANKNEVFPIPQNQIDLSGGKLKQNLNY